jgi:hypothetical protein
MRILNGETNMKLKSIFLATLFPTLVISNPVSAFNSNNTLKVAVVKNATGTRDIINGNFSSSIKKLTKRHIDEDSYGRNMSLCVAYLQIDNARLSESSCTAAINSIEAMNLNSDKFHYLKSLSYSNRGLARYKNADISGALADLNDAVLIDDNVIAVNNLKIIKQYSLELESSTENTALLSD